VGSGRLLALLLRERQDCPGSWGLDRSLWFILLLRRIERSASSMPLYVSRRWSSPNEVELG
jgi:hypothetical protein